MLRVAVSYCLILLLAAGQAVICCCAFKPFSAVRHTAARNTIPSPPQEDSCPHCKKHQSEAPSPAKSPDPEKQRDRCPCKDQCPAAGLAEVVPDAARAWSPDDAPALVAPLPEFGVFADALLAVRPRITTGLRDGPWLSSHDLLTTHHVIRC